MEKERTAKMDQTPLNRSRSSFFNGDRFHRRTERKLSSRTKTNPSARFRIQPLEGAECQRPAVGRIPEYHASFFDIFKKIRRAEQFGIPVRLSEAEKRFSRAERFGIDSVCGPDEIAKAEELKRKARADRFELLTLSMATDEEAKKKARLARFASFL
ncbi:unnamed protein product [Citrullus colocynthis]|uniref:THO1-MOS11 C-terminal domain-containing protein n=1 Tax=Citrullus colocynthis TaxID=252529 RepID=A0ABP0YRR5_9ROSI